MALIEQVCDLNNVASLNPLTFDFGTTLVRGWRAIIYRVLYLWCTYIGTLRHAPGLGMTVPLPDLPGATYSERDLAGLRSSLVSQAKEVEFVDDCDIVITPVSGGAVRISATITLTDNKAYQLEVSVAGARVALLALRSING